MLEPNYGTVGETDMPMAGLINMLADPAIREDHLHQELFGQYGVAIRPTHVLSPTPAIALAGYWSAATLREVPLPEFLSFTAGLVMPQVLADAGSDSEPQPYRVQTIYPNYCDCARSRRRYAPGATPAH